MPAPEVAPNNPGALPGNDSVVIRGFGSGPEYQGALAQYWPHQRPNSVFIAAMGNHWLPGCWEAVMDLYMTSVLGGLPCWLEEIPDLNQMPADQLGAMRGYAALRAQDAGFEWLLLIENDVKAPPDMLLKLTARGRPLIIPHMVDRQGGTKQYGLYAKPGTGVRQTQWAVMSCLLISTKVFNCFGSQNPFGDAYGMPEGWIWNRFHHFGHDLYVDSDVTADILRSPGYRGQTWAEHWGRMERRFDSRNEPVDRKPLVAGKPGTIQGVYAPNLDHANMKALMEKFAGFSQGKGFRT